MHVHPSAPTDPDAFLRWNLGREGKRELVNGKVVENMIRVTRQHARLVVDLMMALRAALDRTQFEVFMVDFGMKTPAGVRYPDFVVDLAGGAPTDLAVTAPVLVCEVLSPSSLATDKVEKLGEYTAVPTVQAYLVLAQDEPRVWLWSRGAEGWSGPTTIEGADGLITIESLSVTLRLKTIYEPSASD
jgi:Uma2 family endonuclease